MAKVPSRIPAFCSRTYIVPSNHREITDHDIGKKVRISDKEGYLRYVGNVHFSTGVWCGVELLTTSGKHDGSVNGKRYFICPQNCGLMAPLPKVQLIEDQSPSEDGASGPFSMLFIDDKKNSAADHHFVVEVKRRRTKDLITPRSSHDFALDLQKHQHSTPVNKEFAESLRRKLQITSNILSGNEDSNKRDSLECEESLGILTPDQMVDGTFMCSMISSRTPSSECIGEFKPQATPPPQSDLTYTKPEEVPSPGVTSVTDFSLGILDEQVMNNATFTVKTDTTTNMELPLDSITKSKDYRMSRPEQTPSPEDLPLDPTPIAETGKSEGKSKTSSSIITSITSITSLDTGYQGDGEMSRPASRGADNSPLTRRPLPRPQTRRPDPMTDSDFYTESDADNHEENVVRGDRRVQVIDGTLYGVDPQAAADIYVNNRENMDSSGIFTDVETSPAANDQINNNVDVSPTDSSTNTISGNSQNNIQELIMDTRADKTYSCVKENPKKRTAPISSTVSSPSSVRSPRHISTDNENVNKSKMPKREVVSKVKSMLSGASGGQKANASDKSKQTAKKPVGGRWDAVMSKISKPEHHHQKPLKEVKSKVFDCVKAPSSVNQRQNETQKRRVRTRVGSSNNSPSIQSSVSDLSTPKTPRTNVLGAKKRGDVVQVLTPSKLSSLPQNQPSNLITGNKKNQINKNVVLQPKSSPKDCGRATTVPRQRAPIKPAPKVAEALAVLVQHLVFNVGAYEVPQLKKQVLKYQKELEEIQLARQHLEELIEQEKSRAAKEFNELQEGHRKQLEELTHELRAENEVSQETLSRQNEDNLKRLKLEFEKLQKNHEESLDILREENEAIREQIDEKHVQNKQLQCENSKLKQEMSKLEKQMIEKLKIVNEENVRLKEENERILGYCDSKENGISIQEVQSLHVVLELKQTEVADLRKQLAEATQKIEALSGAEERAASLNARCEDLELQLERKNEYEQSLLAENKKLSDSFKEESNQKKRLCQYNEELQWKLQQNKEVINKVLEQAVEEKNFNRSILTASFNERHLSTAKSNNLERTLSFREPKNSLSSSWKQMYDSLSPPTSPKVKGIVEKSDWVSYELDMNESPEIMASRIVRRSFRHGTPPKTTPTKSPSNKRPRMKNPLSLSASASEIPSTKTEYSRSNSLSAQREDGDIYWMTTSTPKRRESVDLDEDDDVDLKLPALPSEMGKGAQALPSPKHLAGEAMISESNSEDESTSSSSVQL